MSKITNDDLTLFGTGCFIAVPMWHQWTSKGYSLEVSSVLRPHQHSIGYTGDGKDKGMFNYCTGKHCYQ